MSYININAENNSVYLSSYSNNDTNLFTDQNIEKNVSIFNSDNIDASNQIEESAESLRQELQDVQDEQGIIGKAWNGIKNFIGLGVGSDKVEDKIEQYENGEITYDEALDYIETYEAKQEGTVDLAANLIAGAVTGTIAVVSGGTLTAAGVAAGAAIGGAVKAGVKTADRATNEINGDALDAKQIVKDTITGAVDGALNVATAGMVKGAIAGNSMKKAVIEGVKTGAKAGAISGAGAGAASYTADVITEKDIEFSLKDLALSTFNNAAAGAVMGGIMGGATQGIAQNKINKTPIRDTKQVAQGNKIEAENTESTKPLDEITAQEEITETTAIVDNIGIEDKSTGIKKVQAAKKTMPAAPDDYSDTKAFTEYMEERMRVQLSAKSEADIDQMIKEIAEKTGVSEYEAAETLAELTQFTSYSQVPELSKELQRLKISGIYRGDGDGISLNKVMRYVSDKKGQVKLYDGFDSNTEGFFLDEQGLKYLSSLDDSAKAAFAQKVKDGDVKLLCIDGWNISLDTDGSYLSYGMFGQEADLTSLATQVIKKAQSEGVQVSEYLCELNSDIQTRVKNILGDDIIIDIISNDKAKTNFYYLDNYAKTISETMAPTMPTQKEMSIAIDTIIEEKMPNANPSEIKQARKLLAEYYDKMFVGFSSENLTEEMVSKYAAIQAQVKAMGKTMDDVVYLIPTEHQGSIKSFDLLLYQYSKANGGIDPDQIIRYCSTKTTPNIPEGKVAVVLDDIVGSGFTMTDQEFKINNFLNMNPDTPVIFTPLCSLKKGIDRINKAITKEMSGNGALIDCATVDYTGTIAKNLTIKERNLLSKLLGDTGFKDGCACTAMPYMMPDNNSDASSVFLHSFLNSQQGNKVRVQLTEIVENKYKNSN